MTRFNNGRRNAGPWPTTLLARAVSFVLFAVIVALTFTPRDAGAVTSAVSSFKLKNGLQVVIIPDHRAPVVTHMIWYRVGSADEPAGKSGVAHFLEHLMFKGTPKIPNGTFSKIIARNGGRENAFTSTDYTAYYQRIARDRLELVMRMEADRMTNLVLTAKEIEPERTVVLEERRSRVENYPRNRLNEKLSAVFYFAHPYGKPVIGWKREVEALALKDITDFYRQFYTPNNAVLIIAGDVTEKQVRPLAEKYYGAVPVISAAGARQRPVEPEPDASRRLVLKDPRVRTTSMRRFYLTPSYATAAKGEAEALELLGHIIGGGSTSRLYRQLVSSGKVANYATAWFSGDALDFGQFGVFGSALPGGDIAKVEAKIDTVLAEVVKDGVTADELARAKKSLVAEAIYARDSQSGLARIYGSALTTGQTVEDVLEWPQRIKAVTLDEVNAAARKYLRIERSATGILRKGKSAKSTSKGQKT